jgi:hypothetical protein
MADEDEIAALVIDNGSGMCKGGYCQLHLFDMQSCGGGGGRELPSAGRIGDGVSYQYGRDVASSSDDDDQRRRMRGHE